MLIAVMARSMSVDGSGTGVIRREYPALNILRLRWHCHADEGFSFSWDRICWLPLFALFSCALALEALLPCRWLTAHPEHRLEQREEESREAQARRR